MIGRRVAGAIEAGWQEWEGSSLIERIADLERFLEEWICPSR